MEQISPGRTQLGGETSAVHSDPRPSWGTPQQLKRRAAASRADIATETCELRRETRRAEGGGRLSGICCRLRPPRPMGTTIRRFADSALRDQWEQQSATSGNNSPRRPCEEERATRVRPTVRNAAFCIDDRADNLQSHTRRYLPPRPHSQTRKIVNNSSNCG